jgi:hypothetical protein
LPAQCQGLLFEAGFEGPLGQPGGGRVRDLLHGPEIDVEPGALVAEGVAGDDFAPSGGEVAELLKFFGGEGARCHDAS